MEIFVDTSAHIALINKKDQYHQRVKDYYLKILSSHLKLVSTNFLKESSNTKNMFTTSTLWNT